MNFFVRTAFSMMLCVLLSHASWAQSFRNGTVTIRTGNDDLRSGSGAQIDFLRGESVLATVNLVESGERLADRTSKTVNFRLDAPLEVANIEFVQLRFYANRSTFGDDEWDPASLSVRVQDGTAGGRVLLTSATVPKLNKNRESWRSRVLETFGRRQTRVRFSLMTGSDDMRTDSQALCEVETDDGRVFSHRVFEVLRDRTSKTVEMDLPPGVTANNIRFARLHFGPDIPLGLTSLVQALWQGDQWEVRNFTATAIEPDGSSVRLASSGRIKFEHPGWWQSRSLRAPRAPLSGANQFVVFLYTGSDDLRTDPNVQPNSELNLRVHLRDGRSILLDTGRATRRHFVGASDTAFFGTFKDWGTAWAVAQTDENIPLNQIQNFSVSMVRGRSREIPRGRIEGVNDDPFRGDDEWKLEGLWVGVGPEGRVTASPSNRQELYNQSQRIFAQWNIGAKLNKDNRVFRSANFAPTASP